MNEVKFKVWTGTEMLGPFDLSQNPKYWVDEMQDGKILLYTGLKDSEGEEIYVGDIIKRVTSSFYDLGNVVLDDGSFYIFTDFGYVFLATDNKRITNKIIGNLYENKELSEEEE